VEPNVEKRKDESTMPRVSGDRFSSQNLSDCAFCPPGGRQFRTPRQCAACARALCLVCRPEVPGTPFLCPECGGGPREDTLRQPERAIARIREAGHAVPFWLTALHEGMATPSELPTDAEELIVPE
jgi:hypothetical protein